MRNLDIFEYHAEQAKQNAAKASQEAYSAMRNMRDLGTSLSDQFAEQQLAADTKANEAWASGKYGHNELLNMAASAVSGVSRSLGDIFSTPASVEAASMATLPQEVVDAYNTVQYFESQGINKDNYKDILDADIAVNLDNAYGVLGQRVKQNVDTSGFGAAAAINALDETTWEQKVKGAIEAKKFAKDVTDTFDISGKVNQTNRDKLDKDLSTAFANISEAWKDDNVGWLAASAKTMAETVKAVVSNPLAIGEYAAENLPSMFLRGADVPGYALNIFNKAVDEYQTKHNGELPSSDDMKKMLAISSTAGLAEKVGDAKLLKALTNPKGSIKQILSSIGTEGLTETYQTAVEENFSKLNTDVDAESLYKAGVIGGATGGLISGAGVVGKAPTEAKAKLKERNRAAAQKQEAIKANDVSNLENIQDVTEAAVKITSKEDVDAAKKQEIVNQVNERMFQEDAKLDELNTKFAEAVETGDVEAMTTLGEELKAQGKVVAQARTQLDAVKNNSALSAEELQIELDKVINNGDVEAAKRTFGSFKAMPESFTEEQATQLADSGLVTEQEAQELRTFVELKQSERNLSQVNENIVKGGVDPDTGNYMLGVNDYRNMVFSGKTEQGLSGLKRFADRHTEKANTYERALQQARATGESVRVSPSFTVHAGSGDIVNKIRQEANYLQSAYQTLSKASSVTTTTEPTQTEVSNKVEPSTATAPAVEPSVAKATSTTASTEPTTTNKVEQAKQFVAQSRERVPTETKVNEEVTRPDVRNKVENVVQPKTVQESAPTTGSVTPTKATSQAQPEVAVGTVKPTQSVQKKPITPPATDTRTDSQKDLELKVIHRAKRDYTGKNTPMAKAIRDAIHKIELEHLKGKPLVNILAEPKDDIAYKEAYEQIQSVLDNNNIDLSTHTESKPAKPTPRNILRSKLHTTPTNIANIVKLGRNRYKITKDGSITNVKTGKPVTSPKVIEALNNQLTKNALQESQESQVTNQKQDELTNTLENETDNVLTTPEKVDVTLDILQAKHKLQELLKNETLDNIVEELRYSKGIRNEKHLRKVAKKVRDKKLAKAGNYLKSLIAYKQGTGELPKNAGKAKVTATLLLKDTFLSTQFTYGKNKSSLDAHNDFISKAINNINILKEYFDEVTPEVEQAFDGFLEFYNKVVPEMDNLFSADIKPEWVHQDMLQYLAEDGKLPENVKTAMTVGMFDWLTANGKAALAPTLDSMRKTLGLDDEAYVNNDMAKILKGIGVPTSSVANSIGKAALQALNFKPTDEAYISSQANLANALGDFALGTMLYTGVLEPSRMNNAELSKVAGKDKFPEKGETIFVKPVSDMQNPKELAPWIKQSIDATKLAPKFFEKMFKVSKQRPLPTFGKAPKAPTTVNNSTQKVSEVQKEIIKKHSERPHFFNQSVMNIFNALGRTAQREMLGYEFNENDVIKGLRAGIEGKNNAIDKELDIAEEFYQLAEFEGLDTPFYFGHDVWKNMRMGMNTEFNTQGSKIHRFMVYNKEWETKADMNNEADMADFILTIGEGFDIVSDKITQEVAINKTMEKLQDPDIKAAIDNIFINLLSGSPINPDVIVKGVNAGEGKMHSLLSIVSYAEYQVAKAKGETSFTYKAFRECDGITNALGFANLQMPLADATKRKEALARTGMFFEDTDYAEYRKRGDTLDSYEALANAWERHLTSLANPELLNLLSNIVGSFKQVNNGVESVSKAGRNAAKKPLMTTLYGAGIDSVIDKFADEVIENFYKKLQKAIKSNDRDTIREQLGTVNKLIGTKYAGKDATLDFEMSIRDYNRFKDAIITGYKPALEAALEESFPEIFEARRELNKTVGMAYELYAKAYEQEVNEVLKDRTGWQKELTFAEKKAIDEKLLPLNTVINTLMSKDLNEGVLLSKSEMLPQTNEEIKLKNSNANPYFSQTKFAKPIPTGKGKTTKSISNFGMKRVNAHPGVTTLPLGIQSLDATTMMFTLRNYDVLNVHDAIGVGSKQFSDATQGINKNFFGVNGRYSLVSEVTNMLNRVMDNYQAMGYSFEGIEQDKYITQLQNMKAMSNLYTQRKLDTMKELKVIGQYFDGANTVYKRNVDTVSTTTYVKNVLGSSQERQMEKFNIESSETINKFTTQTTYDKLKELSVVQDSVEHDEHLQGVLTNLVNKVIQPFNLNLGYSTETGTIGVTNGTDMTIINQIYGANSPSGVLAVSSRMSSNEVFVHELVHNVTQVGLQNNTFARGEINKLWNQAKKVFTVEDFMPEGMAKSDPMYEAEYQMAKARYDHAFEIRPDAVVNGKRVSNHLHEFVALGLTNEKFRKKLATIPYKGIERKFGNNLVGKLQSWFYGLLDNILANIMGTKNKTADKQLEQLALALANVDSSAKTKLKRAAEIAYKPVAIAQGTVKTLAKPFNPLTAAVSQQLGYLRKPLEMTYDYVVQGGKEYISKNENLVTQGVMNLATEAAGRTDYAGIQHDLKRIGNKLIDQARENMHVTVSNAIQQSFTKKLSSKEQKALTFGLGKTDAHVLVDSIGFEKFSQILRDSSVLADTINEYKDKLQQFTESNFYNVQSENLGRFMVTGMNALDNGLLNAYNIANLFGYDAKPSYAAKAEPIIDTLASLYAVKYLSNEFKENMISLIDTQTDGVQFSINALKQLRNNSAKEFKANKVHMIKGFMSDNANPDIAIKVGTSKDMEQMAKEGFAKAFELQKDIDDPTSGKRILFVNKAGGNRQYLAGNLYLSTITSKGTKLNDLMANAQEGNIDIDTANKVIIRNRDLRSKRMYANNFLDISNNKMVPLLNGEGKIIGYRYVMNEATKDALLDRDTDFTSLMGIMEGNLVAKQSMEKQNQDVIKAAKQQYDADYRNNPSMYVEISFRSTDARIREIYAQMPKEARDFAQKIFRGPMVVRKDQLNLLFGYRKHSITDTLFNDKQDRHYVAKVLGHMLETVLGKQAAHKVLLAENFIQELVKATKDIIVVKSLVVTLGNTVSNIAQLWMKGIPMVDIAKDYTTAFEALRKYKKFEKQRSDLQYKLDTGNLSLNQRKLVEIQLIKLEDELANNPIGELVEEGVLQNIVEDVTLHNDPFSIKNKFTQKVYGIESVDKALKRIPAPIKTIATNALVMQGSRAYDAFSFAAQFSDFGARYVMYKHLVDSKKMTKKDAVAKSVDAFINYDLPSGKYIQYMNDIGLLWFTKYLVRVQKTIFELFKENPAKVLSFMFFNNVLNLDVPNIVDSSMLATSPLTRIDDPISMALGAANDVVTAKALGL